MSDWAAHLAGLADLAESAKRGAEEDAAMGASERRKGAQAEREARVYLSDRLGDRAVSGRRLAQTRDGGHDLTVAERIALEVKRQERASLQAWMAQAVESAGEGMVPAVMWRPSRNGWLVVMRAEDWCDLVRETL